MKSFRTLLRLARRDVETLRRALADQIQRQQTLEQRVLGHDQAVRAEQQAALKDYESSRAYGGYAVAAVATRRALDSERDIILAEIDRLRTLISEALVETRKFERLIALEEAREKAVQDGRENAELDEFATLRAARIRT